MEYTDAQKAKLYEALFADGVDNWEGYQGENYQEVIKEIELENEYSEIRKKLDPLFEIICDNVDIDYPAGREAGMSITFNEAGAKEVTKWIYLNIISERL